ncbi:MAG: CRISPR-associated protein Cse1 [Magnetococcales bacterium]|nr:CRISPR-associated protein Cse1 [Magnetococcales bacterium]
MTAPRYNLLDEPHIRVLPLGLLTLPGLLAALARDEVEGFPALRPHQVPLWHMFLVQLAALALHGAGETAIPADEHDWKRLLRGLTTRNFPDDEPWCLLVNDWTKPAFMQPPVPPGVDLEKTIQSPDALDLLITSKNHDLKQAVARDGTVEDWVFALMTQQTGGTYDVQNAHTIRTGNIYAPRVCMGLAPMFPNRPMNQFPRPGAWFHRDVQTLLKYRSSLDEMPLDYQKKGEVGLTWIEQWQNGESLQTSNLDIWFIEACRRIRITSDERSIYARKKPERTPRVVGPCVEKTNDSHAKKKSNKNERVVRIKDPWTPEHKTDNKVFTLTEKGFSYKDLVKILFGENDSQNWTLPILLEPSKDDLNNYDNLFIVAYGLAGKRDKAGTLGFHSRILPLSGKVSRALGPKRAELHQLAQNQMKAIAEFNVALREALISAAEKGSKSNKDKDHEEEGNEDEGNKDKGRKGKGTRIKKKLDIYTLTACGHLDRYADSIFFERLWVRFEAQELGAKALHTEEEEFTRLLWDRTQKIFAEALPAMPCTGLFRHRAEARARQKLKAAIRKKYPDLFTPATTPDTDQENADDASR